VHASFPRESQQSVVAESNPHVAHERVDDSMGRAFSRKDDRDSKVECAGVSIRIDTASACGRLSCKERSGVEWLPRLHATQARGDAEDPVRPQHDHRQAGLESRIATCDKTMCSRRSPVGSHGDPVTGHRIQGAAEFPGGLMWHAIAAVIAYELLISC
jgi:hypothetical protein